MSVNLMTKFPATYSGRDLRAEREPLDKFPSTHPHTQTHTRQRPRPHRDIPQKKLTKYETEMGEEKREQQQQQEERDTGENTSAYQSILQGIPAQWAHKATQRNVLTIFLFISNVKHSVYSML
jgi:hypothetical protein